MADSMHKLEYKVYRPVYLHLLDIGDYDIDSKRAVCGSFSFI